jgi:UDP-glucose 4-epimerase
MSLKNKSVLVTGGAGFIGSHLVDALVPEEPASIVVVDNYFLGNNDNLQAAKEIYPTLKIYHQNAKEYDRMKEIIDSESIDVVFNLAVIPLPTSLEKPEWTFRENIEMAMTICELARMDTFDTLIHFSSSEAYGSCVFEPMNEQHPLNGTTTYAASKAASDLLVLSYYRTFRIDTSIIRPFNNFGPRQNQKSYAGVIPLTIKRILSGGKPIIYGDGQQTRDYLYVSDTAHAAIQIYNSSNTRGRVLNIASGKEITIERIITMIAKHLGYTDKIIYEPERPGDVRRHLASISLAEKLIGFKPNVGFEEGLQKTIDWYRSIN